MLNVRPIRALSDNYIWLLTSDRGTAAAAVDPGAAAPVLDVLRAESLTLTAILVTHHHADHWGGLAELRAAFPKARAYGPRDARLPGLTDPVAEGAVVELAGLGIGLRTLAVPGHTATHLAWFVGSSASGDAAESAATGSAPSAAHLASLAESSGDAGTADGRGAAPAAAGEPPRLFCGDTLFAAGCGRVFDGTFEQLAHSLERLAALPGETLCYCAHEYTLDNLGFAAWVEPESAALAARTADARRRQVLGQPNVPSRLALELATNPFLRTRESAVIAAAERVAGRPLTPGAAVFRALREWKDREYD